MAGDPVDDESALHPRLVEESLINYFYVFSLHNFQVVTVCMNRQSRPFCEFAVCSSW